MDFGERFRDSGFHTFNFALVAIIWLASRYGSYAELSNAKLEAGAKLNKLLEEAIVTIENEKNAILADISSTIRKCDEFLENYQLVPKNKELLDIDNEQL